MRPNLPGATFSGDDLGATQAPPGDTLVPARAGTPDAPNPGETLHAFPVPLAPTGASHPDADLNLSTERTTLRVGTSATISGLDKTAVGSSGSRPSLEETLPRTGDPRRIHRFAVLRQLGAGGMGVVYAGYDEELERRVAIKVVREDMVASQGRSRMLREAQAMAKVSHPNVVQVYEVGEFAGQVFVAMEFVKGI
ncbi:MAG TPA: protein kinase, partial [Nannocystis sp.]